MLLGGAATFGGVPWTFIALGVLVSGLRAGSSMARPRDAWMARVLGWMVLIALLAFVAGAFGASMPVFRASVPAFGASMPVFRASPA
jgi:hypothetical protein